MEIGSLTDIGMKRKANQDNIYASKDSNVPLFLVADGMGGHKAGEIASKMAKDIIVNNFELREDSLKDKLDITRFIKSSIEETNTKIYLKASRNKEYKGMGTTLTMSYIEDNTVYLGHVGDSRAYIIRDGKINQLTEDHSYVNQLLKTGTITKEEAKNHPNKNMITKAVGSSSILEVDLIEFKFKEDDILILSTDGLTNMVSDLEILEYFNKNIPIQKTCEELVKRANFKGGQDNISIVAVKINKEVKA